MLPFIRAYRTPTRTRASRATSPSPPLVGNPFLFRGRCRTETGRSSTPGMIIPPGRSGTRVNHTHRENRIHREGWRRSRRGLHAVCGSVRRAPGRRNPNSSDVKSSFRPGDRSADRDRLQKSRRSSVSPEIPETEMKRFDRRRWLRSDCEKRHARLPPSPE